MFPAHPVGGHGVFRRRGVGFPLGQQRVGDVIGVGGFRQIVDGADLDCGHGGGNRAISGQDDHATIRAVFAECFHHVKTVAIAQTQVDNRIGRRAGGGGDFPRLDAFGGFRGEPTLFHRAGKARYERHVIIDQKQAGIRPEIGFQFVGHGCPRVLFRRL